MKFDAGGTEGTVTAKPMGDKIVGEFELGGQTGTIELKKVTAIASATPPPSTPPANPPPSSSATMTVAGDWEAAADLDGQSLPLQ